MNNPIRDNIAAAVQSSRPLSITYLGTWVPTKVIWNPQTKKPDTSKI